MLAACDRGLALLDLHLRTLGATELRTLATANGATLADMALRHAVRRRDARLFLEWSERWRGDRAPGSPPVRPSPTHSPRLAARDLAALRNRRGPLGDGALEQPGPRRPPWKRERRTPRELRSASEDPAHPGGATPAQAESFRTADP